MEWLIGLAGLWLFFQFVIPILLVGLAIYVVYRFMKGNASEGRSATYAPRQDRAPGSTLPHRPEQTRIQAVREDHEVHVVGPDRAERDVHVVDPAHAERDVHVLDPHEEKTEVHILREHEPHPEAHIVRDDDRR